jgi:hypothetical protein
MENVKQCIQDLEVNFNRHFLEFMLAQNKGLLSPVFDDDVKAQEQLRIADEAYQKWHKIITTTPSSTDACTRFFASCKDASNLLLARDAQIFNCDGVDIFSIIFDAPGYDISYRYSLFDHVSKSIFWNVFVDIYRLSIVSAIYNNIPEVRKILNLLLKENTQGITASTLMTNVKNCLRHNKEFRKLFKRLMKQGEAKVAFIFESINYVLTAIQSNVADPWDDWVKKTGTDIEVNDARTRILIFQAFNSQEYEDCYKWLPATEVNALKNVWLTNKELQDTVSKYLWSVNTQEIQKVMTCMKDGDDASIQKIMKESTIFSAHANDEDITQLMKEWETELEKDQAECSNPSSSSSS